MANVTVSAVDVTISTESFGGAALPSWKMLGVFEDVGVSTWDLSFAGFNSTSFKDWNTTDKVTSGSDYSSYLETGYDLLGSPAQDGQPIYVFSNVAKTSKTQEPGGFYETPTRISSLMSGSESLTAPGAQGQHAGTFHDGLLYITGGSNSGGLGAGLDQNLTYSYNPSTDVWTNLADLPGGINDRQYRHACEAVGNNLYTIMGTVDSTHSKSVFKYDIAANTWETLTDFPGTGRSGLTSAVVGTNIYIFGGILSTGGHTSETWRLDTTTDTWTQMASTGVAALSGSAAVAYGGNIYVYGGVQSGTPYVDDLYRYNVASNDWTTLSPSGADIAYHCISEYNGYLYALGGLTTGLVISNDLWRYDISANSWVQLSDPSAQIRTEFVMETSGNKLYVVSGLSDTSPKTYLSDLLKITI